MSPEDKPCLISCGILKQEIEQLVDQGLVDAEPYFLESGLHMDYGRLEKALRGALEKRRPECPGGVIVVYGDVCLGFDHEIKDLVAEFGAVKVEALNCLDCLLGGRGRLLEIDPEHKYLFLTPAWIDFAQRFRTGDKEETRELFRTLQGIILLDGLGNLEEYREEIEEISDWTGLPIVEKREVGLGGLRDLIGEAGRRARLQGGSP